mmetsp:Transcript_125362/g.267621  ORF Transcript_125362/g.267621 Transcript_125362/m.267621 type:complete len:272 (+) Transcript_125362:252-1067(+)
MKSERPDCQMASSVCGPSPFSLSSLSNSRRRFRSSARVLSAFAISSLKRCQSSSYFRFHSWAASSAAASEFWSSCFILLACCAANCAFKASASVTPPWAAARRRASSSSSSLSPAPPFLPLFPLFPDFSRPPPPSFPVLVSFTTTVLVAPSWPPMAWPRSHFGAGLNCKAVPGLVPKEFLAAVMVSRAQPTMPASLSAPPRCWSWFVRASSSLVTAARRGAAGWLFPFSPACGPSAPALRSGLKSAALLPAPSTTFSRMMARKTSLMLSPP